MIAQWLCTGISTLIRGVSALSGATTCSGAGSASSPRSSAILLIGGNKTGQEKRFYKTMIPKADALYDAHLKTLQAQPKP